MNSKGRNSGVVDRKKHPRLVLDGVGRRYGWLEERTGRKILRIICRDGFVCYGGKLATNFAVNRTIANEFAGEEAPSCLSCQTGEQF